MLCLVPLLISIIIHVKKADFKTYWKLHLHNSRVVSLLTNDQYYAVKSSLGTHQLSLWLGVSTLLRTST